VKNVLKGITIKPLKRVNDERGSFTEIYREDWKDLLGEERPVQANVSITYPNMIRAWHRHARGQTDYMLVLKGAVKICVFDDETKELDEIVSSGQDPQIVRVPGHYWHGYKAIGDKTSILVYFTTRLYDYDNPDEERRRWDDVRIVPRIINGDKNDPRVDKSWDWNSPPHK